jgi:NAD(P)-dependent dehydrogenase (short-subunit alcohol dehydrogenase family)
VESTPGGAAAFDWTEQVTAFLMVVMNLSFENKVALVTGAGSAMGLATAKAFTEAGAAVVLADISENSVRSVAEELVPAGHKAIAIRCNVADEAEVAAMIEQTVSTFGRLDAAFNNAGVQSLPVETAMPAAKNSIA